MRKPDFENNILKVLKKEKPQRATLFELFISPDKTCALAGHAPEEEGIMGQLRLEAEAFAAAGYDYVSAEASEFTFPTPARDHKQSISLNGQATITDWASFEAFPWMDPDACDYSRLEKIRPYLPEGMKLMIYGSNGVLEHVMNLVGYDNLCIMLYEEPELVQAIFDRVGAGLLRYYEIAAQADTVGFLCANDDWGFKSQTFLSPADMRKYVFPWHKKIVEAAHRYNKPCILHSCGCLDKVAEDIIEDMRFDGRHSYQDNILPVEEAYERYHDRIAVIGGLDIHYLATSTPEVIYARARAMLERSAQRGGYLLGSGNSIPAYIPMENYLAMNRAALDMDP